MRMRNFATVSNYANHFDPDCDADTLAAFRDKIDHVILDVMSDMTRTVMKVHESSDPT